MRTWALHDLHSVTDDEIWEAESIVVLVPSEEFEIQILPATFKKTCAPLCLVMDDLAGVDLAVSRVKSVRGAVKHPGRESGV